MAAPPRLWAPGVLGVACEPGSIVFDVAGGVEAVVVRVVEGPWHLVVPKYLRGARLLSSYSAGEVAAASRAAGLSRWVERYSAEAPLVDAGSPRIVCVRSFGAHVAPLVGGLLGGLGGLLGSGCLGVTGSLLAGHWSPAYSDVDLLVDVSPSCLPRLLDALRSVGEPLGGPERRRWLLREARARGVGVSVLEELVPWWQRLRIGGVTVSLAPVSLRLRARPERRWFSRPRGWGCVAVELRGFEEAGGDYPALLRGREGGCVVVYDGFYAPALLEGGRFEACGPLVEVVEEQGEVLRCVAVGGREGGVLRRLRGP